MDDSRRKESRTEEGIKERQSEATSKDTLNDLSESEKLSGSKQPPSSERASVPSPDGQEGDQRRDPVDVP